MKSHWKSKPGTASDPVGELVYASQCIGKDSTLVVWGGGNSSVKAACPDFRGRTRPALYIKGSGSDMRTLERANLAVLDLEAVLELRRLKSLTDEAMVEYLGRCQMQNGPRPSIETLLHAFLPAAFVLHTHADATAALTDNPHSSEHVKACYGGKVGLVPYERPGFSLSIATWKKYLEAPGQEGILLDKHGLITWAESGKEAYAKTLKLVGLAENYVAARRRPRSVGRKKRAYVPAADLLPVLRGELARNEGQILCLDRSEEAVQFSLRQDVAKLAEGGPATPDHLLYTKPKALVLEIPAGAQSGDALKKLVNAQVDGYRRWYDAYFKRYVGRGLKKLDSAPRVVILPGLGVVTTGKDPRTALIGRDIFRHSAWVRQAAKALGGYQPIGLKHICDFEYWPLENYKLTLAPAEKEFSRKTALVTGAARGIGRACALALAEQGACVAVLDLKLEEAAKVADEICLKHGPGRGLALQADISDEYQVETAFVKTVLAWGGLDILVNNAGLARCAPVSQMPAKDWEDSFKVNARGHFLCAREAARIFKSQGLGGNMVFISSKNVLAPGKDFAAYSASKAAQTQLAKVLALELAPLGVRVNSVTPDGVFEDSRLWDGIRESRAKAHGIPAAQLQDFYWQRNLLKTPVSPGDVAQAMLFLASPRSAKTTGTLLPVDGGVKEAFPR